MQATMSLAVDRVIERWAPWVVLFGAVCVWALACWLFSVPEFIFPGPWQVAKTLWRYAGPIADHALQTFWTTMLGFFIGVVVGVVLGVIIGSSRLMHRALYRLMVGFNSVPKSAFVPILVVWFGIGAVPAVATAALISFFPITINVATGLSAVDPELHDVLRVLGATRLDMIRKVGIPSSMPYFFASLKVGITLAFIGTIISETIASNNGIGYLMISAGSQMQMPLVFAGLLVISAMAMAMYELFAFLERRLTGWAHRSHGSAI
jgi:NitT/TauT family transport system permease protein